MLRRNRRTTKPGGGDWRHAPAWSTWLARFASVMSLEPQANAGVNAPPLTVGVTLRDLKNGRPRRLRDERLTLQSIERHAGHGTGEPVVLHTDRGDIVCRYHAALPAFGARARAVLWVGGATGGLEGPAGGLYPAACHQLQERAVAGLRLHYRRPNELPDCILDTLVGVSFLRLQGFERTALVGYSFGGAVVISAGAVSESVTAVVAISTQTYGANLAPQLSPRSLLLVHGADDRVLPSVCSELVYAAAREPKELKVFAGADHGLDAVRDDLLELLVDWTAEKT